MARRFFFNECLITDKLLAGGSYQTNLRSVGFITLTWCLVSFVFVNIYSSCLTSYMSLTSQRPDINSLKDLATDPNYQLTNLKGTFTERMFMVNIYF